MDLDDLKPSWGPGPWQHEPDHMVWIDNATNLDCMIHRNYMGALCGYVGVDRGHPWYGKSCDDVDVTVHGGLSYGAACDDRPGGICHVPEPGRPADIWWFGFDCAHAWDIVPRMLASYPDEYGGILALSPMSYKTIDYVGREVTDLAQQIGAHRETPRRRFWRRRTAQRL